MANEFRVLSDLSKNEIINLEDKVIHLIKARAGLVPTLSLPNIIDMDHILAKTISIKSCTENS